MFPLKSKLMESCLVISNFDDFLLNFIFPVFRLISITNFRLENPLRELYAKVQRKINDKLVRGQLNSVHVQLL